MSYLLDTHIWIWAILSPERLTRRVSRILRGEDHEIWLSPISLWELQLLVERERISLDSGTDLWIRDALSTLPLLEAPVTHEVVQRMSELKLRHRDPADRFLAGTALAYDLVLITADQRLLKMDSIPTLANR